MLEKILALLEQIEDESIMENIYWYVERKLVQEQPKS